MTPLNYATCVINAVKVMYMLGEIYSYACIESTLLDLSSDCICAVYDRAKTDEPIEMPFGEQKVRC